METWPARASISAVKCGVDPAAGDPKFAFAGLAFTQARNSGTLVMLAGTAGPTASANSNVQAMETGTRSLKGSYCSFL